jgi:hypothetical protein
MSTVQPENYVSIYRGSSKTLELTVYGDDGQPIDLTGARIVFSVKADASDRNTLIQKDSAASAEQAEVYTPRSGIARVYLNPTDTTSLDPSEYVFDVWAVLSSGKRYPVIRPSVFEVLEAVTVLP